MDKSPNTKILSFTYGVASPRQTVPDAIFTHHIDNEAPGTETGSYTFSETLTNSYTWSWSTTLTTSVSISVSAGIPDVCDIKETFSFSISNTQSQSQSTTTTKTWSTTANYDIEPNQTLAIDYVVSRVEYVVPYTMTVQFGDHLAYWCSNQVNGHWFWMPDVGSMLAGQPNCSGNVCYFQGVFNGVQGIGDSIKYRSCPLGVQC